jgi:hypothetical protein
MKEKQGKLEVHVKLIYIHEVFWVFMTRDKSI